MITAIENIFIISRCPPFSIKKLIKKSKLKTNSTNNKRLSVQMHKLDEQKLYPMLVDFVTNSQK